MLEYLHLHRTEAFIKFQISSPKNLFQLLNQKIFTYGKKIRKFA
jgi:hypothetical protein